MMHEPAHVLAGNKRYKLEPNLDRAIDLGLNGIISFGGAWSNYVAALAHATRQRNMHCLCIIRGESESLSNPTLSKARQQGMQFEFIDRSTYRLRDDANWLESLRDRYPEYLLLPEGGSNLLAVESCSRMLDSVAADWLASFDVVACPVGTGATLTGLGLALTPGQQARGYQAVQDSRTHQRIQDWSKTLNSNSKDAAMQLVDASGSGFARLDEYHYRCIDDWLSATGILLDPVYTVKMVATVKDEINRGLFPARSRILLVHTGGFQGWQGWLEGKRKMAMQRILSSTALRHIKLAVSASDREPALTV